MIQRMHYLFLSLLFSSLLIFSFARCLFQINVLHSRYLYNNNDLLLCNVFIFNTSTIYLESQMHGQILQIHECLRDGHHAAPLCLGNDWWYIDSLNGWCNMVSICTFCCTGSPEDHGMAFVFLCSYEHNYEQQERDQQRSVVWWEVLAGCCSPICWPRYQCIGLSSQLSFLGCCTTKEIWNKISSASP